MDLIILSTAFGGLAFSDPWLIVVVIFQSLTASHMLQTNPMAPTKAPAASGTHSFIKAACPGPFPPFPQGTAINMPSLASRRWRGGRPGLPTAIFFQEGQREKEGNSNSVWDSHQWAQCTRSPVGSSFSIELTCFDQHPLFFTLWLGRRSPWQPWCSSAAQWCGHTLPDAPGHWDGACPGGSAGTGWRCSLFWAPRSTHPPHGTKGRAKSFSGASKPGKIKIKTTNCCTNRPD